MCILGNLNTLVNGYSTQEISIKSWLNQEDPLYPFMIFLLVAEGLSELNNKIVELELLSGFRTRPSNLMITHL